VVSPAVRRIAFTPCTRRHRPKCCENSGSPGQPGRPIAGGTSSARLRPLCKNLAKQRPNQAPCSHYSHYVYVKPLFWAAHKILCRMEDGTSTRHSGVKPGPLVAKLANYAQLLAAKDRPPFAQTNSRRRRDPPDIRRQMAIHHVSDRQPAPRGRLSRQTLADGCPPVAASSSRRRDDRLFRIHRRTSQDL
jgi:hypothetical protein